MRRLLLVNALIFAVLAAAAALAYYGYSATSEQTSRDRELALMLDLAEEKVLNIESLIDDADKKFMRSIDLDEMSKLKVEGSGAAVRGVFVLDDQFRLVPDGARGRSVAFRDWFMANVLPQLPLATQPVDTRGHLYLNLDQPYLFSYMRRVSEGRTFYVVIEDDLFHVVGHLFPQFFIFNDSSKRLYQVVDDQGEVRYGAPFGEISDGLVVERRFTETWDGFVLRVAQKDLGDPSALKRKRLINSVLIGGAVTVILAGLLLLGFAIRRERRLNELKTPLSIISMFGEMLAEGRTKSPEQAHEYAEIIWRESVRLGRLIDNVLDFAKIERGMGGYEFAEDTDITEVVDRVIELSGRRVQAADMTLEHEIEPDLPYVRLDGNAYTLAVLNLIDNAIKYAADGKKIALTLRRDGDRIVLSVRDWGAGIDPEEHERIFERFYRAKAIRLKPIRGSGIGLALVRHIARAHRGDVEVTSSPENGSTFSIWIPIDGK